MKYRSRITSKGQVTIPKEVRDQFGLRSGDAIEWEARSAALQVRKIASPSPFDKWRGYLKHLKGQNPDELVRNMRGE